MPSAWPRGMIVALWTGSAAAVLRATRAWPPSWYAVSAMDSADSTAEGRSAPIRILSLAKSRAAAPTVLAPSTAALSAAWFTKFFKSAPLMPGVPRATVSRSTVSSRGTWAACNSSNSFLPWTSGKLTATCLSKRPGLRRAASSASGKFVAPRTMTPAFCSKPSISTSNWFSVIFMACCSLRWRDAPMASISSMNTIHGARFLAASNKSRTRLAPTPTYISSNSEPEA
mmetsp:Transcript_27280/g.83748  ORF Transcript_27280/g.83748 Transcript_27280/m.83748 type:complete len:228 (-) Transcript_27280:903-1586(-)